MTEEPVLAGVVFLHHEPLRQMLPSAETPYDPLEVGRRFNVQAVLAGRVELAGDRIVLSAELLSSSDGHRIWGERYERVAMDAPSLPGDIVVSVAEAIGEPKQHRHTTPRSFHVYQVYLQGRYAWNKRPGRWRRREGDRPLRGVDSARSGVGPRQRGARGFIQHAGRVGIRVGGAARRIREGQGGRDARVAPGPAQLGGAREPGVHQPPLRLESRRRRESLQAIAEAQCRLNANYSHAHHWYAHLLIAAGRVDEALAESRRLLELDPLDLIMNVHLAWHYYMAGNALEALNEARRVLDMERSFHWGWFFAGLALGELGERQDAVKKLERAVDLSGRSTVMLSALGYARAAAGDCDEAIRILHDLGELARSRYVSALEIALIHLALGDVDASFEWLDRAHDERSGWLPYAAMEPRLAPLRHDARFQRLLERIGLTPLLHPSPYGA